MGWWPDRKEEPAFGSVDGDHDVYFKVSDSGETLIADAKHGSSEFNRYRDENGNNAGGQHDHYGSGNGPNDNGTDRGWYTGPGA